MKFFISRSGFLYREYSGKVMFFDDGQWKYSEYTELSKNTLTFTPITEGFAQSRLRAMGFDNLYEGIE